MFPAIHVHVFLGVALLDCWGLSVQFYKKIANYFLNWLYQFILPPAMYRRCSRATYSATRGGSLLCANRACVNGILFWSSFTFLSSPRRIKRLELYCSQVFPFHELPVYVFCSFFYLFENPFLHSSLYITDINPLSVITVTNIIFLFVFFTFLKVSIDKQELLIWI